MGREWKSQKKATAWWQKHPLSLLLTPPPAPPLRFEPSKQLHRNNGGRDKQHVGCSMAVCFAFRSDCTTLLVLLRSLVSIAC